VGALHLADHGLHALEYPDWETLRFDVRGRYQSDTDAYGNVNTLTYGPAGPTSESNSGGRALVFTYNANGQLADAQSPLWQSGGASAAGSQHVTYGYDGCEGVARGWIKGDARGDHGHLPSLYLR